MVAQPHVAARLATQTLLMMQQAKQSGLPQCALEAVQAGTQTRMEQQTVRHCLNAGYPNGAWALHRLHILSPHRCTALQVTAGRRHPLRLCCIALHVATYAHCPAGGCWVGGKVRHCSANVVCYSRDALPCRVLQINAKARHTHMQ